MNNHVCGTVGSEKLFRQGCTRAQCPIWLRGRVHISVNVLRRVAAKLAVHSAINVIIWPFSILSRIPIVGVGCIKPISRSSETRYNEGRLYNDM